MTFSNGVHVGMVETLMGEYRCSPLQHTTLKKIQISIWLYRNCMMKSVHIPKCLKMYLKSRLENGTPVPITEDIPA